MSNSFLTPTQVTREALRVLHEKIPFIRTVNRQYDDSYAKSGAKIGSTLKIRKPNQYTVRTGKVANVQDTEETSVTLTMATQKGVDLGCSSSDLTLSINDFSRQFIEPAMSALASNIEQDVLSTCTKKVYNSVGTAGTTPATMLVFGQARQKLNEYLAPKDKNRFVQVDSATMASMVDSYKGLFEAGKSISDQYVEGYIARQGGFDWYENESIYQHATGTDHTSVTVNDASIASGDSTITTSGANVAVGTVFTFSGTGVKAVHPETKVAYSHDQQFVLTAVSGNDWTFDPPIISTGAKQNVSTLPTTGSAITIVGSASTTYGQCLAYHRDAFTFVSADLEMPKGVDWAARERFEGISMRIIRDFDTINDDWITRIDVLYGTEAIRPQLACRITK